MQSSLIFKVLIPYLDSWLIQFRYSKLTSHRPRSIGLGSFGPLKAACSECFL
jgi:hypothetical protein